MSDFYEGEEAQARFDAALKKALNVTGPKVSVREGTKGTIIDVDLNVIEKRGRDKKV